MQPVPVKAARRRKTFLRDGVFFLLLSSATVGLFGITLLLFHSFESHRAMLAKQWSQTGRTDMQSGHPADAIAALRVSLNYAPDDRDNQLLLAQALADAGHIEEARNYFLNLWETSPGDGFINLQLARLARREGHAEDAEEYYRASLFGSWQGDGVERRRAVRLELADYLTERHDLQAARAELLIGAGNTEDNPDMDLLFGDKLRAAGDLPDALTSYQKAIDADPRDGRAYAAAGQTAYALHDFVTAHKLLVRAGEPHVSAALSESTRSEVAALAHDALRAQELSMSPMLAAAERARHLQAAAPIAQARLNACVASQSPAPPQATPATTKGSGKVSSVPPPLSQNAELADLQGRWKAADSPSSLRALRDSAGQQDTVMNLVNDTESVTAKICGAPAPGDDAILLMLATGRAQ